MYSHRRAFLCRVAVGTLALTAAGCTATPAATTLDVKRIVTDGQAIVLSLQAVVAAPAVIVLLGPQAATAGAAFAAANAALIELQAAASSSTTLALDTARVQALVQSLLADARTVLALVGAVLPHLSGDLGVTVGSYVAAARALLPLVALAAALPASVAARKAAPGMTEQQALAIAGGAR